MKTKKHHDIHCIASNTFSANPGELLHKGTGVMHGVTCETVGSRPEAPCAVSLGMVAGVTEKSP